MVVEIRKRWIGYGVMLAQAILIALCLSAVCYSASLLPSDILDGSGNGCVVVGYCFLWEW